MTTTNNNIITIITITTITSVAFLKTDGIIKKISDNSEFLYLFLHSL
jgi:hypothetical protein